MGTLSWPVYTVNITNESLTHPLWIQAQLKTISRASPRYGSCSEASFYKLLALLCSYTPARKEGGDV